MDKETLEGAARFEAWMKSEDERLQNETIPSQEQVGQEQIEILGLFQEN